MEISLMQILAGLPPAGQDAQLPGKALGSAEHGAFAGVLDLLLNVPVEAGEVLQCLLPEPSTGEDVLAELADEVPFVLPALLGLTAKEQLPIPQEAENKPVPVELPQAETAVAPVLNPLAAVLPELPVNKPAAISGGSSTAAEKPIPLKEAQHTVATPDVKAQELPADFRPQEPAKSAKEPVAPPVFAEVRKAAREMGAGEQSRQQTPAANAGLAPNNPFLFQARPAMETPAGRFGRLEATRAGVVEQVLEKMVLSRQADGEATLTVRLKPAVLGEVEIRLRMEDGLLTARIVAESRHVKEALDAALGLLRQRLEAQQIQVADVTVTVGQEQHFRQRREANPWTSGRPAAGLEAGVIEEIPVPAAMVSGIVDIRA